MAEKQKRASATSIGDRIRKARGEGRTQQALELARQLYKHEPTGENLELLRQASLERGDQLRKAGYLKDAVTVLGNCIDMGGSPEFQAKLAEKLAASGAVALAMKLTAQVPEGERAAILGHLVDSALRQGPAGKAPLPLELHASFDLITEAFALAEKGDDEAARTALQGIGLQSPFLEWKLMLRGLLAWYANDDSRALENWQRLDSKRLPWRIAAPFRAGIDPAFRDAQTPESQRVLRQLADRIGGSGWTRPLQVLQQLLAKNQLREAFRQVEALLPAMRRDHPDIVPRLGHVFFWEIVTNGEPSDVPRMIRLFGAPPDDPKLSRLEALAAEHHQIPDESQELWIRYEGQVATHPEAWPPGQSQRVRALIWEHLGGMTLGADALTELQRRVFHRSKETFKLLSAEHCYRRSIELAPDRLGPHEQLIKCHLAQNQLEEAFAAGRKLLEHIPNHVETLSALGGLHECKQEYQLAQAYYERALQANPLVAPLRIAVTRIHQIQAMELLARSGKSDLPERVEEARRRLETAWQFQDHSKTLLRCRRAVLEMHAGEPDRAAAAVAEALATPHQFLAVAHALHSESVRAKLPTPKKKKLLAMCVRSEAVGNAALEAFALIEIVRVLNQYPPYRSQKTDAKKAIARLDSALMNELSESQLANLCDWLNEMDAAKASVWAYQAGQRRFPKNPLFLIAEAAQLLGKKKLNWSSQHRVRQLLARARKQAATQPRELQESLIQRIEELESHALLGDDPLSGLRSIMSQAFGGYDDDFGF